MRIVGFSAVVVSGAMLLSGCQLLGIHRVARASAEPQPAELAANPAPVSSTLQAGRVALTDNRNGAAIDAFNLALANGEDPAAAYNGLGVAYSRIGRTDLAYRFFGKARMSDPANPVYARNLAMLMDSPSFTLQLMQPDRARPVAQAQFAAAPPARPDGVRLVRDSGRQFSLVTVGAVADQPVASRSAATRKCGKAKRETACGAARLPRTASRSATSRSAASRHPVPAAVTAQAASADTPAPKPAGKRKVLDLSAALAAQSARPTPETQARAVAVANSGL